MPADEGYALPAEGTEERWRAEDDARTLTRAEEIKADGNRVKMALAVLQSQDEAVKKARSVAKRASK